MKLTFTVGQFLEVFREYNTAIWPAPVLAYLFGVMVVVLAVSKTRVGYRGATGILSLFWMWNGALYHLIFFSPVNPAAILFGLLFIAEGLLLAVATFRGNLHFDVTLDLRSILGGTFVLYAMLIYPLLGMLSGHVYPRSPVFGVAPCPTVIFTFGVLLWTRGRVPAYLFGIPFLWSLVGGSAALKLGVPEDFGLAVSGLIGTAVLLTVRFRRFAKMKAAS